MRILYRHPIAVLLFVPGNATGDGEVVDGATLAAVAGVLDWARRLRELHDELGYAISSRQNDPSLKHGQYRLKSLGARQTKR